MLLWEEHIKSWGGSYSKWPNDSHFGLVLQYIAQYLFSSTLAT